MKKSRANSAERVKHANVTQTDPENVPLTDIYEEEDSIIVRCDVPGVDQDDVDARLDSTEFKFIETPYGPDFGRLKSQPEAKAPGRAGPPGVKAFAGKGRILPCKA